MMLVRRCTLMRKTRPRTWCICRCERGWGLFTPHPRLWRSCNTPVPMWCL
jgi:hypothetical protein